MSTHVSSFIFDSFDIFYDCPSMFNHGLIADYQLTNQYDSLAVILEKGTRLFIAVQLHVVQLYSILLS